VDWHEQLELLKLEFPVNVVNPRATYEVQFGAFSRPAQGDEEPGLQWFDVTGTTPGGTHGLAVINNAKYSHDVLDSRMRLTVLRGAVYAHHLPRELHPEREHYYYLDQGRQEFRYRLLPHHGDWAAAQPSRYAQELNAPLISLLESNHAGDLPTTNSLLTLSAKNVLLSAVKHAEEGEGTILRVYEAHGQPTTCDFIWAGRPPVRWNSTLRPFEIQSFLIAAEDGVTRVNFLERSR
jgi:alpha-mannosidase